MDSSPLVREGVTDLTPFSPQNISIAHQQWLSILTARIDNLNNRRLLSRDDFNYSGSMGDSMELAPLEEGVEEARRMVWRLGGEVRRRSEGELPVWVRPEASGRFGEVDVGGDERRGSM